ncbi:MAG: hypothetical protein O2819_01375 [Planctomycetota bacterium]|nr:hypothetical protein [Planctomycetota bacterium]MDA1105000.1 hypothetical protein [Planctomycetota bacterium]
MTILALLAGAATVAAPADWQFSALAPVDGLAVGKPFVVEYRLDGEPGATVLAPHISATTGAWDIVDVQLPGPRTVAITFVVWTNAEEALPTLPVVVVANDGSSHEALLPSVTVLAATSLPQDDPLVDMGAHKGVLSIPGESSWRPWAATGSALAILGCAAGLWVFRRRPVVVPSDEEVALAALDRLEGHELGSTEEAEQFWFDVTGVLRTYIGTRFQLRAPELTTHEFLAAAREGLPVSEQQKERLRSLLDFADRVKFARHRASPDEARMALRFVRGFVRDHAPRPELDAGISSVRGSSEATTC